jgi:hypothetical protein
MNREKWMKRLGEDKIEKLLYVGVRRAKAYREK